MQASPNVEALPPEPIQQTAPPAAGARAGRRRAKPLELVLSAILPGAGHVVRGEWRLGMTLLISWGVALGLAFLSVERIQEMKAMRRVPVDTYVGVPSLAVIVLDIWVWSLFDLLVRGK